LADSQAVRRSRTTESRCIWFESSWGRQTLQVGNLGSGDVYFATASDRHDLPATMVAPRLMASRLQTASEAYAPLACEIVGGLLTLIILTVLVVPAVCGPEGQLWSTAARISNCDSSAGSIRTRCDCDRNGF